MIKKKKKENCAVGISGHLSGLYQHCLHWHQALGQMEQTSCLPLAPGPRLHVGAGIIGLLSSFLPLQSLARALSPGLSCNEQH